MVAKRGGLGKGLDSLIPSNTSTLTPLESVFIPSLPISSLVVFPDIEETPSTSIAARPAIIATTSSAILTSPRSILNTP